MLALCVTVPESRRWWTAALGLCGRSDPTPSVRVGLDELFVATPLTHGGGETAARVVHRRVKRFTREHTGPRTMSVPIVIDASATAGNPLSRSSLFGSTASKLIDAWPRACFRSFAIL